MKFDLLIPTRGNFENLKNIFLSIDKQTLSPQRVFVAVDKKLSKDEFDNLHYFLFKYIKNKDIRHNVNLLTNINADCFYGRGVSWLRNYLVSKSKQEFLYFLDDDNEFDADFFERTLQIYSEIYDEQNRDFIFSPKIIYRKSWVSQSEWIKEFNFALSKVVLNTIWQAPYSVVKMIWANSLFGKREIFEKIKFDERFQFVYEDLDFSYRCYLSGFPIIVSSKLGINHMERTKTRLEKSFIWSPSDAYQKSRNRIFFVKKNGTPKERIMFFCFALWLHTFWFFYLILIHGKNKIALFKAVIKWTLDWINWDLK